MNLPRRHWIVILSLVLLFICGGLWFALNRDEPKFQGKTADQWFNVLLRAEGPIPGIKEAVVTLNTNFIPVLLNACGRSQDPWWDAMIKNYPLQFKTGYGDQSLNRKISLRYLDALGCWVMWWMRSPGWGQ